LIVQGDAGMARRELVQAIDEDPGYARSREVLDRLGPGQPPTPERAS
jgi:hypothetical protein